MKNLSILLLMGMLCMAPMPSKALSIIIYGSGGISMENGKTKVCPDWAWLKKCAVIKGSLRDLWTMATGRIFDEEINGTAVQTKNKITVPEVEVTLENGDRYYGNMFIESSSELKKEDPMHISLSGTNVYFELSN